jgi:hypothetical protein
LLPAYPWGAGSPVYEFPLLYLDSTSLSFRSSTWTVTAYVAVPLYWTRIQISAAGSDALAASFPNFLTE